MCHITNNLNGELKKVKSFATFILGTFLKINPAQRNPVMGGKVNKDDTRPKIS